MSGAKVVHTHKAYSRPEELTNIITYALAAVLSFVGLVFLLLKTYDRGFLQVFSSAVFGTALLAVFTVGALCHLPIRRGRGALLRADRCAVALLVFGVSVPALLVGLSAGGRSDVIWSYVLVPVIFAAAAVSLFVNLLDVTEHKAISLIMYVIIGWATVIRAGSIASLCGWQTFWMLFGGGAAYFTGGAVCSFERLPARHTLWHLFVIVGAALHFVAIYSFLL